MYNVLNPISGIKKKKQNKTSQTSELHPKNCALILSHYRCQAVLQTEYTVLWNMKLNSGVHKCFCKLPVFAFKFFIKLVSIWTLLNPQDLYKQIFIGWTTLLGTRKTNTKLSSEFCNVLSKYANPTEYIAVTATLEVCSLFRHYNRSHQTVQWARCLGYSRRVCCIVLL